MSSTEDKASPNESSDTKEQTKMDESADKGLPTTGSTAPVTSQSLAAGNFEAAVESDGSVVEEEIIEEEIIEEESYSEEEIIEEEDISEIPPFRGSAADSATATDESAIPAIPAFKGPSAADDDEEEIIEEPMATVTEEPTESPDTSIDEPSNQESTAPVDEKPVIEADDEPAAEAEKEPATAPVVESEGEEPAAPAEDSPAVPVVAAIPPYNEPTHALEDQSIPAASEPELEDEASAHEEEPTEGERNMPPVIAPIPLPMEGSESNAPTDEMAAQRDFVPAASDGDSPLAEDDIVVAAEDEGDIAVAPEESYNEGPVDLDEEVDQSEDESGEDESGEDETTDDEGTEGQEEDQDDGYANIAAAGMAGAVGGVAVASALDEPDTAGFPDPEAGEFPDDIKDRAMFDEHTEMVEQSVQTDLPWEPEKKGLSRNAMMLALCGCLVLVVLAIVLPLTLIDNDDDETGSDFPTFSPVTGEPTVSMSPTEAAPSTPTPTPGGPLLFPWDLVGGQFEADSNAVAIADQLMVVGDRTSDTGSVQAYLKTNDEWSLIQELQGQQEDGRFGEDVALTNGEMLVGAPGVFVNQTSVPAGAAYYYEYDRTSEIWSQLGSEMKGDGDFFSANEDFGYSVGLSKTFRVAIGAPGSNDVDLGAAAGQVYTFEYQQVDPSLPPFEWFRMQDTAIRGLQGSDQFGFAVAISTDGSFFVAGAPGNGMGNAFLYEWSVVTSSWEEQATAAGLDEEAFGSSVAMLSDDGSIFAVGGPGYGTEQGVVRVYSAESGSLEQIGPDIVGAEGERLGERNSVSGFAASDPTLILSTADGTVLRLEYDATEDEWVKLFELIITGSLGLTASASSADAVATAGDGSVAIYEPDLTIPSRAPTPTPPTPTPPTSMPPTSEIPTLAPTTPMLTTQAPTPPQTLAPTVDPQQIVGGPFAGPSTSNFGRAVDISALIMAAGAPGSELGQTFLYQFTDAGWVELDPLTGEQANGAFGLDVAVNGDELLVGAPGVFAAGTSTPVGVAYYYRVESDGSTSQVGSTIRGDEDFFAAVEGFGSSVAASVGRRIVIGAPGSNVGGVAQAGRVYPFEFSGDTQDWVPMQEFPIGGLEKDNLGFDVDISNDGSRFIAGGPTTGSGFIEIFEWDDASAEWLSIDFQVGAEDAEQFGRGVSMISDNGSLLAAGGPNFNGGQGVIRVYENIGFGYSQLGPDILGEANDALGNTNTFSGDGMSLVAGTANGLVKRFEYDADVDNWVQVYDPIDTGYTSLSSSGTTDAADTFVVAGDNEVTIYKALVV